MVLKNLWRRKTRTLLTLLGRAILAGDLALPDELREAAPALKRLLEQV